MKDYIQALHKYLYEKQIADKDKQIKQLEIQTFNMKTFVENVKRREKTEYIYIATTEKYAMKNHFKIGRATNLKNRLPGYQTGRPSEDLYFYVWTFECHSSTHVESRIKHLLTDWKETKEKEMYVMHFEALLNIVKFICENYNNEINKLNEFITNMTTLYYNKEPILLKRSNYVKDNITGLNGKNKLEENKTEEKIIITDMSNLSDDKLTKCVIMILNKSIHSTSEKKDFDFNKHKNDNLGLIIDWNNIKNTAMMMFNLNKNQLKIKTILKPKIKELEQANCFKKTKWR